MTDMAQADRTLRTQETTPDDGVFARHKQRMQQMKIPTTSDNIFSYDYGLEINNKLVALKWTPQQYDMFLDWLHQEKPLDDLVADLLMYAPVEWIMSEADAIGVFDMEQS